MELRVQFVARHSCLVLRSQTTNKSIRRKRTSHESQVTRAQSTIHASRNTSYGDPPVSGRQEALVDGFGHEQGCG